MGELFIDRISITGFTSAQRLLLANEIVDSLVRIGKPRRVCKRIIFLYSKEKQEDDDEIVITSKNLMDKYPDFISVIRGKMLIRDFEFRSIIKVKHPNGKPLHEKRLGDFEF